MDLGAASQKWQSRALILPLDRKKLANIGSAIMYSRKLHAVAACTLFLLAALIYSALTDQAFDAWRVALWSCAGVALYIVLSSAFGFDPHRTRIAEYAPALVRYVDRWELRLGQATLSMLGCVIVGAKLLDEANFVTAVVSGTLAAWTYFALRLYTGGYDGSRRI